MTNLWDTISKMPLKMWAAIVGTLIFAALAGVDFVDTISAKIPDKLYYFFGFVGCALWFYSFIASERDKDRALEMMKLDKEFKEKKMNHGAEPKDLTSIVRKPK